MLSDLELMEIHVNVLFNHDIENRMTVVNEPPFNVAPKIFIGSTKKGSLIKYSNTLDTSFIEKLERVIEKNNGVNLVDVINGFSNEQQLNNLSIGPAYVFSDVKEKDYPHVIQVTPNSKGLLKPFFPYTYQDFDYKQPCFVIVENNIPVSICCSARKTTEADEASVFTHADYRGKGYGRDVTLAWAAEVQKQGRVALYSTSWDNFASQSIARNLKLHQYGIDIHMS